MNEFDVVTVGIEHEAMTNLARVPVVGLVGHDGAIGAGIEVGVIVKTDAQQ